MGQVKSFFLFVTSYLVVLSKVGANILAKLRSEGG
jgi:hypothetical protein